MYRLSNDIYVTFNYLFDGRPSRWVDEVRHLERIADAARKLYYIARLRGDNLLPAPADDPLPYSAAMQEAWNNLADTLGELGVVKEVEVDEQENGTREILP